MIVKAQSALRAQREEPCVIKEGDLLLVRDDLKGFVHPPRVSSRVIMNNSTISIFMSDNFGDIQFSSNLKDLAADPDTDEACFKITNKRNKTYRRLCGM